MRKASKCYEDDPLMDRQILGEFIKERKDPDGFMEMVCHARGCDGGDYTYARCVPATVMHYVRLENHWRKHADGPCFVGLRHTWGGLPK